MHVWSLPALHDCQAQAMMPLQRKYMPLLFCVVESMKSGTRGASGYGVPEGLRICGNRFHTLANLRGAIRPAARLTNSA